MAAWDLLFHVLLLLGASFLLGALFERIGLSALVGFLLAGTLLGPHAFAVVGDPAEVAVLAELGVALLLFSIGLEFSWARLRATGGSALGGGVAQVVATALLVALAAVLGGLGGATATVVGAMLALSSTACVLPVLVRRAELDSMHGRHVLGILLVQDVAVVPLVVLVETLKNAGTAGEALLDLGRTSAFALGLVLALRILSNLVLPRLLGTATLRRNRELAILVAVLFGVGAAYAAHAVGISPAFGAFVAGMMLAASPFATQVRADVGPLRTLLLTLFFSSVGMLADPRWIAGHLAEVSALVAVILVAKAGIVFAVLRFFGLPAVPALAAGIALGQAGEFAFVIGSAAGSRLLGPDLVALLSAATIVTLFLAPLLVARAAAWSAALLAPFTRRQASAAGERAPPPASPPVIVVGYGPTGRAVVERVAKAGARPVVIDLNPASVAELRRQGIEAHVGDATRSESLDEAGIAHARAVVVTLPDPASARLVLLKVERCDATPPVIVRARYHRHAPDLARAGARIVVDEEREMGRAMADAVGRCLAENGA